jgi:hypothetical protein
MRENNYYVPKYSIVGRNCWALKNLKN